MDGDSLVVEAMDSSAVSFANGHLHLSSLVKCFVAETLLKSFRDCGAKKFVVVFSEETATQLCTFADDRTCALYRVARESLRLHLASTGVKTIVIESYDDDGLWKTLDRPSFVLLHDGSTDKTDKTHPFCEWLERVKACEVFDRIALSILARVTTVALLPGMSFSKPGHIDAFCALASSSSARVSVDAAPRSSSSIAVAASVPTSVPTVGPLKVWARVLLRVLPGIDDVSLKRKLVLFAACHGPGLALECRARPRRAKPQSPLSAIGLSLLIELGSELSRIPCSASEEEHYWCDIFDELLLLDLPSTRLATDWPDEVVTRVCQLQDDIHENGSETVSVFTDTVVEGEANVDVQEDDESAAAPVKGVLLNPSTISTKFRWNFASVETEDASVLDEAESPMSATYAQKYYRYMAKYGESLEGCRSLHHKVLTDRNTCARFSEWLSRASAADESVFGTAPALDIGASAAPSSASAPPITMILPPTRLAANAKKADKIRYEVSLKRYEDSVRRANDVITTKIREMRRMTPLEAVSSFDESWRSMSKEFPGISLSLALELVDGLFRHWAEQCSTVERDQATVLTLFRYLLDVYFAHRIVLQTPGGDSEPSADFLRILHTLSWIGFQDVGRRMLIDAGYDASRVRLSVSVPPKYRSLTRLAIDGPPLRFQLVVGHADLERDVLEGAPDSRVRFTPDRWQRDLLDIVDQRKSALVVAPTSSGKTFISYYCMERVMRESDEGLVIYVSPSKALANQVAAEINVRFASKKYADASRHVYGVFLANYQVNVFRCQVLVTLPEVFDMLLLSPDPRARSLIRRTRYVIFDEVHCMSDPADGPFWNRVLQLNPAPFVALSATVQHPLTLAKYLGRNVELVTYGVRFADLELYRSSSMRWTDKTVVQQHLARLDLSSRSRHCSSYPSSCPAPCLTRVHPLSSHSVNSLASLDSNVCISMTPQEAVMAADALGAADLDPDAWFANHPGSTATPPIALRRSDAIRYTQAVVAYYVHMAKSSRDTDNVAVERALRTLTDNAFPCVVPVELETTSSRLVLLLSDLHQSQLLPALVFNMDREACMHFVENVLEQFETEQERRVSLRPDLERQRRAAEKREAQERKRREKEAKKMQAKMQDEQRRDAAEFGEASAAGEDDDDDDDAYEVDPALSFADESRRSEFTLLLEPWEWRRLRRSVPAFLIRALRRGIGCHHSGLPKMYRDTVEVMFRAGYLRVVFSTETLALGLNMPCRTVVFANDSPSLDALYYRQMAGRAGRRGLDKLGRVVFFDVPEDKRERLVGSALPNILTRPPLSCSVDLRLRNYAQAVPIDAVRIRKRLLDTACIWHANNTEDDADVTGRDWSHYSFSFVSMVLIAPAVVESVSSSSLAGFLRLACSRVFLADESHSAFLLQLLATGMLHKSTTVESVFALLSHVLRPHWQPRRSESYKFVDDPLQPALYAVQQGNILAWFKVMDDFAGRRDERVRASVSDLVSMPLGFGRWTGNRTSSGRSCGAADALYETANGYTILHPLATLSGMEDDHLSTPDEVVRLARDGFRSNAFSIPFSRIAGARLSSYALDLFLNHSDKQQVMARHSISPGDLWEKSMHWRSVLSLLRRLVSICSPFDDPLRMLAIRASEEADAVCARQYE